MTADPSPGAPAGIEPAVRGHPCWGQWWSLSQSRLPHSQRSPAITLNRYLDVPAPRTVIDLERALQVLVGRHEALRTTFASSPGGLERLVWPVPAVSPETAEFADEQPCLEWLRRPFDVTSGWPLRVALVRRGGTGSRVGVAVHHTAADWHGMTILCRELGQLLTRSLDAGLLPPVGRQPTQIAAFEVSPEGASVDDAAVRYWTGHGAAVAEQQSRLSRRATERLRQDGTQDEPRMNVVRLASRRAATRLRVVARGTSSATVVLAAFATVLADELGVGQTAVTMSVSNRHLTGGAGQTVCSLIQAGLAVVPTGSTAAFDQIVSGAWHAAAEGRGHAHYDEVRLASSMAPFLDPARYPPVPNVNFVPGWQLSVQDADPARENASSPGDEVNGAEPRLELVVTRPAPCASLYLHAGTRGADLVLELRAGDHLYSRQGCERLLRDLESRIAA